MQTTTTLSRDSDTPPAGHVLATTSHAVNLLPLAASDGIRVPSCGTAVTAHQLHVPYVMTLAGESVGWLRWCETGVLSGGLLRGNEVNLEQR